VAVKAVELYAQLEKDFITPALSDDWFKYMEPIADFICDNYKKRSMGLVCDNAKEIRKVYTAVFPSDAVMQNVLDKGEGDIMLFLHHPSNWDIAKAPPVFHLMNRDLLDKFKEQRIAIYNLHVPLDNFSEYSTSATLAKALELIDLKPFYEYYGSLAVVYGKTTFKTVPEIRERFAAVLGHRTGLYLYGSHDIMNGIVAVAAGGGNIADLHEILAKDGVNLLVTGVTVDAPFTHKAHEVAKEKRINILGGTHYSTEKPACQAMCGYFKKLGLPAEFIEGTPGFEDL
jgi:putative NIF3 family GTP cyclohydrolase 1 type 2